MRVPDPERPRPDHILLVDDDTRATAALGAMLREDGYEVHESGDGLQAMDHVLRHEVDALVTDLHLPRLGGLALLSALRRRLPSCEAFVLTAYPDWRSAGELRDLGIRQQFIKPVEYDALHRAIRSALASHR